MSIKQWERKYSIILFVALFIIMLVVFLICFIIVRQSNQIIKDQTKQSLAEVSEQSSIKVNQRIQFNLTILEEISNNLILLEKNPDLKASYIRDFKDRFPFEWVTNVGTDGLLLTDGKEEANISDDSTFQAALKGSAGVSQGQFMSLDGVKGNLYITPNIKAGNIIGVTVGWVPPDTFQKLLSMDIFEGEGFTHIINTKGDFIVRSENKNAVIKEDNFFDTMEENGEFLDGDSLEAMKKDIADDKSGHIHFKIYGNTEEAMEYTPLGGDGWFLLSVVPMSVYGEQINNITQLSLILSIVIFILFLLLIGMILYLSRKSYLRLQKLAYEDPITGGYTA